MDKKKKRQLIILSQFNPLTSLCEFHTSFQILKQPYHEIYREITNTYITQTKLENNPTLWMHNTKVAILSVFHH